MASQAINSHTTPTVTVTAKESFLKNPDLMAMTISHLQKRHFKCLLDVALTCKDFLEVALDAMWEEMYSWGPLLKVLPALQVRDEEYVLSGNVSQADCDRLQYYSQRVKLIDINPFDRKVHPSTFIRISQLQPSALFPSIRLLHYDLSASGFLLILFPQSSLLNSLELYNIRGYENTIVGTILTTLSSSPQMLNRIVLRNGQMPVNILKKSIVHFKQLRSLNLSIGVFMSDFSLWEVLGTLPFLENLTLESIDPASHPAHAPENSNRQSGGPQYFDVLESLCVTGSFFFIQHLLDFIDSPNLKSIEVYPIIDNVFNEGDHGPDNPFTPSMTIVASKWSQSLKRLYINPLSSGTAPHRYSFPKSLTLLLTDFHEMQEFTLEVWKMENTDEDVRRLVMSWPKLRYMVLPIEDSQIIISFSTLRIIAENCPQLHRLCIRLDTTTIPPPDNFSQSLGHRLKVLHIGRSYIQPTLECQIQIARHLDLIFPFLKGIYVPTEHVIWSEVCDLIKLCQDARRGHQPRVLA